MCVCGWVKVRVSLFNGKSSFVIVLSAVISAAQPFPSASKLSGFFGTEWERERVRGHVCCAKGRAFSDLWLILVK